MKRSTLIRAALAAATLNELNRRQGELVMGTTHTARLGAPPREPNQVPDGLKDDVGKHDESEFNDEDTDELELEDDDDDQFVDDDE